MFDCHVGHGGHPRHPQEYQSLPSHYPIVGSERYISRFSGSNNNPNSIGYNWVVSAPTITSSIQSRSINHHKFDSSIDSSLSKLWKQIMAICRSQSLPLIVLMALSTSPRNILELEISICDAPLVQIFERLRGAIRDRRLNSTGYGEKSLGYQLTYQILY